MNLQASPSPKKDAYALNACLFIMLLDGDND